jgi:nicotinate-nucleotide--dimethylbenzimidazole phosphoribosyltransferase
MEELRKVISSIVPTNKEYLKLAQERLDSLTKPKGSLGMLEDLAKRIASITQTLTPTLTRKVVFTMVGDHGVCKEEVSAFPQEVTQQMVYNFARGGAGINVLARYVGAKVIVVDMGVCVELEPHPQIVIKKVGLGTKNMVNGPSMTRTEAIKSISYGIELAKEECKRGANIIGTGDMGIGNTTPSTAILACYTNSPIEEITGRGTGVDDRRLKNKIAAISKALEINKPDKEDPIDVLSKVGGFEIGGLAGVILGASSEKVPVVIDGFISGAAALIATRLQPLCTEYLFASHTSAEVGHKRMIELMGLRPILDLNLRLGEGTGACLGMNIIEAGCKILTEMATFSEAEVSEGTY